jgi:CRP-like cAMP-binding protein
MNKKVDTTLVSPEVIKESPLGADLSKNQCKTLAGVAGAICLKKGTSLLEEGHSDDTLYVVVSGSLEVIKPTGGGDIITLQLLHAGDMAGILGFVDGVPHSAGIRALRRCELIALDRKSLEQLLKKDPELVYQVMRSIVRTAHRILARMNTQFVEMSNYISKQHGRY